MLWQKKWFQYISKPDSPTVEPPGMIQKCKKNDNFLIFFFFFSYLDVTSLLCEHNKLRYNPVELIDYIINPVVATRVIKKEEWEKIHEL